MVEDEFRNQLTKSSIACPCFYCKTVHDDGWRVSSPGAILYPIAGREAGNEVMGPVTMRIEVLWRPKRTIRALAPVLLVLVIFKGSLCIHVIQIDKMDDGYENIMVTVHRDVNESQQLLDNIKLLFQAASDFLHTATGGRVYFKTVTIGVPSTWQIRKGVKRILADDYMSSHVRVENSPHGEKPYSHHIRHCGEHGHYIRITPQFVLILKTTTKKNYGNPAYHLIHEWAHFRYGVFDEHAASGDPEGRPAFYCDGGRVVKVFWQGFSPSQIGITVPSIHKYIYRTGINKYISTCTFVYDCPLHVNRPPRVVRQKKSAKGGGIQQICTKNSLILEIARGIHLNPIKSSCHLKWGCPG
ncbi:calcium-activated chloride channel regulator 1-like [Ornithodoros turicata]|uniref:calcium-activated chloride channel regulator 1-like n=1 Tax=Ornithodoros turicata TaxID=34597 RepID=UPI003138A75C